MPHHSLFQEVLIWITPSLSLKYSNFTQLIVFHVLELHCSSMHHILDIVELDLNVLLLVMEHIVFRQLHVSLIVIEDTSHIQLDIKQVRQ